VVIAVLNVDHCEAENDAVQNAEYAEGKADDVVTFLEMFGGYEFLYEPKRQDAKRGGDENDEDGGDDPRGRVQKVTQNK
jgi:hypothetical protein